MPDMKLAIVEAQFANIIWENEPIHSRALAELCEHALEWKRTTTYTVLKRLCDRGIFQNDGGIVTSVLSKHEFYGLQGEKLVEEAFDGSLPALIAAFTKRKSLTAEEAQAIRHLIDSAGEE